MSQGRNVFSIDGNEADLVLDHGLNYCYFVMCLKIKHSTTDNDRQRYFLCYGKLQIIQLKQPMVWFFKVIDGYLRPDRPEIDISDIELETNRTVW